MKTITPNPLPRAFDARSILMTALVFFFVAGCASNSQSTSEPDSKEMEHPSPASTSDTATSDTEPQSDEPKSEASAETSGELLPAGDQAGRASVEPQEISAFVETYRQLQQVRQTYEPRIVQASSRAEAEAIQQKAVAEMETTIEKGSLSPERFAEIATLANQDPELNQKIQERL